VARVRRRAPGPARWVTASAAFRRDPVTATVATYGPRRTDHDVRPYGAPTARRPRGPIPRGRRAWPRLNGCRAVGACGAYLGAERCRAARSGLDGRVSERLT